jgi:hypothetical protein
VQALQQSLGNEAVRGLLEGKSPPGMIARQVAEEQSPLDPAQLGLQRELPGHGDNGTAQNQGAAPAAGGGGRSPAIVNAVVGMTVNPPTEESKPAADIAAAHNKPGVAGWTTPAYDIKVPHVDPNRIDVNVTLDFKIELAQEYKDDTLKVLRDHEYGHVDIGKEEGQEHLVNGLHDDLSALPNFSSAPPIRQAIVKAAQQFSAAEGNASQAYDSLDYPRMEQAYLGARTPLAKLEAAAPNITTMAKALRGFASAISRTNAKGMITLAQKIIEARDRLTEDELAQLQYNPEFKKLVTESQAKIEAFIESYHWDLWIIEFSTLGEEARNKLDELKITLADFTWQAPVKA